MSDYRRPAAGPSVVTHGKRLPGE